MVHIPNSFHEHLVFRWHTRFGCKPLRYLSIASNIIIVEKNIVEKGEPVVHSHRRIANLLMDCSQGIFSLGWVNFSYMGISITELVLKVIQKGRACKPFVIPRALRTLSINRVPSKLFLKVSIS
jgi:hypothetical protein